LNPHLDPVPALLGAFASALVGALFAAGDTAFTTLSSARLGALIDQSKGKTRKALERIRDEDAKLRSRYLLGRVLCTAATAAFFERAFENIVTHAFLVALLGTVVVTGTLFEITTTLARKHADRVAPTVARYLRPLEIAFLPLAIPLGLIGGRLARMETEDDPDPRITEVEVELLVDEGEKSGLFAKEPAEMIRNVLEFSERTARDVMIPREKVEAIDVATPIRLARKRVSEVGHSRYPLYKDQLDNVVGILHAKDLFKVEENEEGRTLRDVARTTVNFVAGTQPLVALLQEMKRRRQHLAVVVDELGSVSGIVTLEDILEEIVGDIRDEHDEAEEPPESGIEDLGDGRLVADANVSVGELSKYLGGADLGDEAQGSLGDMLREHFGKVPETGAALKKFGMEFIVRDVDDEQIGKIEIRAPQVVLEGDPQAS
jgi:magnesium and cobalt exporter, CNNM family